MTPATVLLILGRNPVYRELNGGEGEREDREKRETAGKGVKAMKGHDVWKE